MKWLASLCLVSAFALTIGCGGTAEIAPVTTGEGVSESEAEKYAAESMSRMPEGSKSKYGSQMSTPKSDEE